MYAFSIEDRTHLFKFKIYRIGLPLWSSGQSSWLQNGDVMFPVRHELNEESRPPLWSSGQSFRLQNGDVLCFL
jgi:hypothetical protein